MRGAAWSVCVMMAAVALAGCAGGSELEELAPTGAEPPRADAQTGAIAGRVQDTEAFPVPNVEVAIQEPNLVTRSDADGRFTFNNLTAGSYAVLAQSLGYESLARRVDVPAGQVVELALVLTPLNIKPEPLVDLHIFDGIIQCGTNLYYAFSPCGGVTGAETSLFRLDIEEDYEWKETVFELVWTPNTGATGQALELNVCDVQGGATEGAYCSDADIYWEYQGGSSPVTLRLIDLPLDRTRDFQVGVGSDWLSPYPAIQQQFTLFVTHCYWEACGQDYTGLPDEP